MEEASIDKVHILHVDDDPDVRLLMAGSLQEFGYAVLTAGTVAEALQLAKDLKFNHCILDWRLPDGSGLERVQHLRKWKLMFPLFFCSAYGVDAFRREP